jgi:hypothetical protein
MSSDRCLNVLLFHEASFSSRNLQEIGFSTPINPRLAKSRDDWPGMGRVDPALAGNKALQEEGESSISGN